MQLIMCTLLKATLTPWTETSESRRGGFNGIRSSSVAGAKDINPELTIERELGLDLGLFDNKINLEFSYFYSNVYDIIMYLPAAPSYRLYKYAQKCRFNVEYRY